MEVLACFVGGWGHAAPLLPLIDLARDRGHHVTVAGQAAVVPRLARLGLDTAVVGPDTLGGGRSDLVAPDRELEREVMRERFTREFGALRAAALADVLTSNGASLVVCDEVDVGAVAAAEAAGVPCVSVSVLAASELTAPSVRADAWADVRRGAGLPADPTCARIGGDLVLAPYPPSLRSPSLGWPAHWRAVRPPILTDDVPAPAGAPRVYATLGTVFNVESGDLLDRLAAGLALVDADVLLTTGPGVDPAEVAAPGRLRVEPEVPLAAALAGCDAVVCHGGSGTLVAALALGIPVVVLPMGADQLDNGDRVVALGCGLVLDPLTATPADIAAAVDHVRRDRSIGDAAAALAAEAAALPSLAEVHELDELLPSG